MFVSLQNLRKNPPGTAFFDLSPGKSPAKGFRSGTLRTRQVLLVSFFLQLQIFTLGVFGWFSRSIFLIPLFWGWSVICI